MNWLIKLWLILNDYGIIISLISAAFCYWLYCNYKEEICDFFFEKEGYVEDKKYKYCPHCGEVLK